MQIKWLWKNGDWQHLRAVILLWAFLFGFAVVALVIFNANASRLVNHIEYVRAGRYPRALVLYEEAFKYAEKALQKIGGKSDGKTAKLSADDPDVKRAIELFGKAFELDPRDPYAPEMRKYYEVLAHLYAAIGNENMVAKLGARGFICERNFRDAEIYAESVTTRDPQDYEGWLLLADAQLRANKLSEAEMTIRRMESAGAPAAVVHELRGQLFEAKKEMRKAIAEYRLSLEKQPSNLELRKRLQWLLQGDGRLDEALTVLEEGLRYGGDLDPNLLHRMGLLCLAKGDNTRAAKLLEQAARLEPRSGDIWFNLAQAYQRLGKDARANDALQEALRLKPELRQAVLGKE
ncbi:MAG: tetratricopeptide repeat protein [Candidatus Sumerlaea chitinivorans]|uniref:TPR domain protein, putative component of TonB system n=1 Tax=Sumerlaea chitinivorans TaxID=2250252 RepID=A0A2Z4Y327_SUMC1|nr:TPR domain protein, putative component of TonB system [Candidatus Sumerlaea chitinivorans]MCX7963331.1 tetratricopeptide repeat protein [Candidatus Sumerlaea chitinivorans]